jgi:hypothetical protein
LDAGPPGGPQQARLWVASMISYQSGCRYRLHSIKASLSGNLARIK